MGHPQQPKRRVAFLLIDGMGDVSIPKLGFKTPLQAAKLPNLDAIASAGVNGLMDPVEVGLGCGSDTAHLSLMVTTLGYITGAAVHLSPWEQGWQCHQVTLHLRTSNFATLDEKTEIVISRRADRHFEEEGPILCAALDGLKLPSFPEYEVRVRYATEHRCGVVVKGPSLSGNISGTDPLKDNRLLLQAEAIDGSDEARHTAKVVNELSKEMSKILIAHPLNAKRASEGKNIANVVLLRGCGIRIEVSPFTKKHGLWPCMVAPTKIIAGLGLSLGIDIVEAPGATGDYRTLLTSKTTAIAKALSAPLQSCPNVFVPGEDEHKPGRSDGYDFGFLHIKAIDDAGHDKATIFKVKGLEAVDRAIGQLARLLWETESTGKFQ
ncbi:putative phosphoglycerate mutase (2,3-diphosphoglycerate-independent) [Rosa chinensis]|uniref:Putative phosphoglycerate mutase (2,3-diphosphoglycerate-independent) n=1 Tax=Rosa chinensis TaxID=74649 RepID=A0A2P6QFT8_ROSCH|nr:putative phosphoglycerate mutase (2,3-diphosphoglycerate-independent) [Rosa chinensis]